MTPLVVEREFRVQTRRTCWFLEGVGTIEGQRFALRRHGDRKGRIFAQ